MRIGYVTQWYDPEVGSAAIPGIIARALRSRGHEVVVLTGFPNYPEGRLYDGYSLRFSRREVLQGIPVHRAPLLPTHASNAVSRIANYLSFAAAAAPAAVRVLKDCDVVLVHSTPATVAWPAMSLRRLRGVPYVLHVQDLWPETVLASDFLPPRLSRWVEAALRRFCDAAYRTASGIAVTSPGMARAIAARPVDAPGAVFVPNWVDENTFTPTDPDGHLRSQLGLRDTFTVMYAGNLGEFQDLETVLRAAVRMRRRSDVQFVIVGGGVKEARLKAFVAERGLENVVFVPSQPLSAMTGILALGDVHVVPLVDDPLFAITLPSKLQATLAVGKAVVGTVTGDPAEVIRSAGAGAATPAGDDAALADALLALADDPRAVREMGRAARDHYEENFAESVAVERLEQLLEAVAEREGDGA